MKRGSPAVTCIVLNWNGWRDTLPCIASLYASDYPNLSVLLVDNGSTDDSISQIRRACPDQEILENGTNLGFGAGNNRGIQVALSRGADYVWLLNNDTLVESTTLSSLVATAQSDSKIGQVGSVLYYASNPGTIQAWGGGTVNLWTGAVQHFHGPVPSADIRYITAASVLLRVAALREVGLFDEKYFMYFEDTDLSFRIAKAGWHLRVSGQTKVLHKEGVSSKSGSARFDGMVTRSAIRFLRKHAPFPVVPLIIFSVGRALKRLLAGKPNASVAILTAYRSVENSSNAVLVNKNASGGSR